METFYIVQLENYVYLAEWEGDPGRTLKKENAKKFKSRVSALSAIAKAQLYRPFDNALVIKGN